jgi:hypothetical protein
MNPTLIKYAIYAALALGALGGAFYEGHHIEAVAFQDYKDQQSAAAEKQAAESQANAREAEHNNTLAMTNIQNQTKGNQDAITKAKNDASAAIAAGTLRLSSELADTRARLASVSGAGATAGGADQAGAGGLPVDTAQFLIARAAAADRVATTFNEAIKIMAQDRVTCTGAAP